jgi:hypothetical protein
MRYRYPWAPVAFVILSLRLQVENGDLNWLVFGKFLAFAGPFDPGTGPAGYHTHTPDDYIPYFKKNNVQLGMDQFGCGGWGGQGAFVFLFLFGLNITSSWPHFPSQLSG